VMGCRVGVVRNDARQARSHKQPVDQSVRTTGNWVREVLGVALPKVRTRERHDGRNKNCVKTTFIDFGLPEDKRLMCVEGSERGFGISKIQGTGIKKWYGA